MAPVRASSWLASTLLLALGCSSEVANPNPVDAGTDAPAVDAPAVDVPVDAGRPMRSPQAIFGACDSAAECRDGMTCRRAADTGLPGGQCNRECTRDDECVLFLSGGKPIDGFCQAADREGHRYCARVCANGIDCERDGYTCQGINAGTINAVNICIPVCTATSCIDGTVCDHESGRCRPADAPAPTGRTLGQSCVANADPAMTPATVCQSGLCNPQVTRDSTGAPFQTGNNGGFCVSRCILPQGYNSSNIWTDMELPRSNCPANGICFISRTFAEGDLGTCVQSCTEDSDCRVSEGYACRKTFRVTATRTRTFTNGFCEPFDCAATGARACPTGYTCRRSMSGTTVVGDCVPST
nr:hypothetical protein [Deltaproteobacteria bacterium]